MAWVGAQTAPTGQLGGRSAEREDHRRGGGDNNGAVFGFAESYNPATNGWTTLPKVPTARAYLAATVSSGKLYAIGGSVSFSQNSNGVGFIGDPSAAVEVYDATFATWNPAPGLQEARTGLAAADVNGTIYAVGGYADPSTGCAVGTVEAYTPPPPFFSGKPPVWQSVASLPTARLFAVAASVNGKLYVISGGINFPQVDFSGVLAGFCGGINPADGTGNPNDFVTLTNVVEVYDPSTNTWSNAAAIPNARRGGEAHVLNGKIYVVGGGSEKIDIYDPATQSWGTIPPQPFTGVAFQMPTTFDPNTTYFRFDGGDVGYYWSGFTIYTYVKN